MKSTSVLIFLLALAFFTFAASHRFYDSAHAIGTIKKGGGMARHPALLDKDRSSYVLIATAGVVPPYKGNARVVLEGDPSLKASFYDSGPALSLGLHRQPEFSGDTYYDLRPKDKIALWVRIKRDLHPHGVDQATGNISSGNPPECSQCDQGDEKGDPGGKLRISALNEKKKQSEPVMESARQKQEGGDITGGSEPGGSNRHGKGIAGKVARGPMLAFYDTATNERLLSIPIRFTGGKGGSENEH